MIEFSDVLKELLKKISHRLVVVGSVARGEANPGDLDLLFDMDSDRAYEEIRVAVAESGLSFDSMVPRNWCFQNAPYLPVEILPIHNGPSYRTVRRGSTLREIGGLQLRVARPEHDPAITAEGQSDE